jgi:hypothetical protein
MTEAEWLACGDPALMLVFMETASDRKHRLFQVACLRRIWHLMPNEQWREAVAVSERYADTQASDKERIGASKKLRDVPPSDNASWDAVHSALEATMKTMRRKRLFHIGTHTVFANAGVGDPLREREVEAHLVRDILGNPFRPVTLTPPWLTSTVVSLAAGIYADRAFDRLPILADALQDAGCDNPDVLDHCRGEGPHARGCWVVDLLLGKG